MAKSMVQKVKGLFMSKEDKNESDTGNANDDTGFDMLNDALAADADENTGALTDLGASEGDAITEPTEASDGILENEEETGVKQAPKAEKTHEKVACKAAEMNTKGYGL